ncbi:MAG: SDR family oxidoreductase [Planctomycetaceae bacterium]
MELRGSKALVTGGGTGIGKAIAAALGAAGADVRIVGRRAKVLAAAAAEMGAEGVAADVSVEADAVRVVEEFVSAHGRIDILVNNAGVFHRAPLVDQDAAGFEAVWRTNVFGAMLMAREAARHFVRQGRGNLVNIASTSGLRGDPGSGAYAASKFALRGLSECWRAELRRHNVRVFCVCPSEVVLDAALQTPNKLRPQEIADALLGALRMDDRGLLPEFAVFATNPF